MALVNDCEAGSVRAPPERGGLALGAALSLALHVGGLVAALSVSLRAEEPEDLVIEVVWDAPAPLPEAAVVPVPEPLAPEPPPQAEPPPEPDPPRRAEPTPTPVVVAEPPTEPEPPPRAEPKPIPPPVVVAEPPPRPAVKPTRRVEAPAPSAQPDRSVQAAPTPAPASPAPEAVAAAPAAPPAPAALPQDDYVRTLLRWLEPHRRYPRAARVRGLEGEVRISLLIDRAGSVIESRVAESSGEPLLDAAALEMVERAAPAPPLPAHWGAQRAVFLVPIRFALSG